MHGSARCLPVLAAVAALVLVTTPGCTRHFYRQAADKDVEGIITQKDIFPNWKLTNWNVYPNPLARYADNTNPDRPPYPPDDYAARLTSPNPQRPTKRTGVGRVDGTGYIAFLQKWDAQNREADAAEAAANPSGKSSSAPVMELPVAGMPPTIPPRPDSTARAVRHPLPAGIPAALRPSNSGSPSGQPQASVSIPIAKPQAPPSIQIARPAGAPEFGPWTAVRPSIPGLSVAEPGPRVAASELRQPVVVIAGEVEQNGKSVPAIAMVPVSADPSLPAVGMQPAVPQPQPDPQKQPAPPPEPLPLPKKVNPLEQPQPGQPQPGGPGAQVAPGPTDDSVLDTQYLAALESKQQGYRLNLEQAVELAVLTARELQDRREDVYLAALPVTLDRFNFAAMGFFTQQAVLKTLGRNLPGGGGESWTLSSNGSISKLFPTGALLMVKLANQVVIDLSNGKPTVSIGNFSLSLMQPFLAGGGLAVNLEQLTADERNLLYALRSFARFRKLFFVAIAAGVGGYTNNPYGLQGLSVNLGRGVGSNLTAPNVGYLPLVYQQAVINNQKRNVAALERLLQLYQAYREGGQFADLQVSLVEVQLLNSRSGLLGPPTTGLANSGMRGYLDTLDNFKLQLGLPLTMNLELDDAAVKPIRQHLIRFEDVYAQVQQIELAGARYNPADPVAAFRKRWLALFTESALVKGTPFGKDITSRWESWSPAKLNDDQMRKRLAALREERRKLLAERVERELKKLPEPPAETKRLAALNAEIDLGTFESLVRAYEAQPWANKTGKERSSIQDAAFTAMYNAFYLVVLEARNDRLANLYATWPQLESLSVGGIDVRDSSLDDSYTAAIQTALSNRLDLMNARAEVVDAWRQIAVTANSLRGVFDVEYDLGSTTPAGGNTPLGFSAGRDTNQLSFNLQLPIVRRAQRNNYRQSLIAYQRQRRTLMAFEDNIANDVRGDVRELRTLIQLYRIQQRIIQVAYAQVDNATAILFAPPVPGAGSDAGSAAALTLQVLQARSTLLSAQNTLYQLWISYLTSRMSFYVDLESMQLDERGIWTDELFNRIDSQTRPTQSGERLPAPQPLNNGGGGVPGQGR